MDDQIWRSLGEIIDDFFGRPPPTSHSEISDHGVANMQLWETEILGHERNHTAFKSLLSSMQLASHEILEEWHERRLVDSAFEHAAATAMKAVEHNPWAPTVNRYQFSIAKLWMLEFQYPGKEEYRSALLSELHRQRQDAAKYASCQIIARASILPQNRSQPLSLGDPLLHQRSKMGARFESCYWLKRQPRESGMPFYLWEVKTSRTRAVREITEGNGINIEYVAISHTWGRWRKAEPWVAIPGVPWKIPQNSKFNVRELPKIMENLHCDYVWLDLLTIPQEESSREMITLQKAEISRQARIFQHATRVIAWLNDVERWNTVNAAIQWLCLVYLKHSGIDTTPSGSIDTLLNAARIKADFPTELYHPTQDTTGSHPRQRNPWFTSLWTLQEVCLRPDMWLCNITWDAVAVAGCVPVTIGDLVALVLVNAWVVSSPGIKVPEGVRELAQLIQDSSMFDFLRLSPAGIVTMGNIRHCTHRRAEAIMSAVGATDWFQPSAEIRDNELVLNLYPLPFVNELRDKVGSSSFFSSSPVGAEFNLVIQKAGGKVWDENLEALGSMLPFRPGAYVDPPVPVPDPLLIEHPALKKWVIEPSGKVRIWEAGILSQSSVVCDSDITYTVIGPTPASGWTELGQQDDVNLQQWLRSYLPKMPNYAVCTVNSSHAHRGIILKELRPGLLIKIGSYWLNGLPTGNPVDSQPVSWLVL